MNKNTKKQLDEAMQREFNESIEDYGIPAEAIEIARRMVSDAQSIVDIMANHFDNRVDAFNTLKAQDAYNTCKYVLVHDSLLKLVKACEDVNSTLGTDKKTLDEVCERKNLTIDDLAIIIMMSSMMNGDK